MNRSRQMGGMNPHQRGIHDRLANVGRGAQQEAQIPGLQQVPQQNDQAGTLDYARGINAAVDVAIGNNDRLCQEVNDSITSIINEIENQREEINLSQLIAMLQDIARKVLDIRGACVNLGANLQRLYQTLLNENCLRPGPPPGGAGGPAADGAAQPVAAQPGGQAAVAQPQQPQP